MNEPGSDFQQGCCLLGPGPLCQHNCEHNRSLKALSIIYKIELDIHTLKKN